MEGPEAKVLKILVVGDAGCGKTSIIRRYVQNSFTPKHKPTIGVDFHLKQLLIGEHSAVRLQLWDIAGQERFGPISRVYYKDAVGALLVYDITRPSTFETVIKWKEEIDLKVRLPVSNDPIPVLLLGNKCDLDQADTDTAQLDRFCRKQGFIGWYDTSAKSNLNIDTACRDLVENILKHKEIFAVQKEAQIKFQPGVGAKHDPAQCCN